MSEKPLQSQALRWAALAAEREWRQIVPDDRELFDYPNRRTGNPMTECRPPPGTPSFRTEPFRYLRAFVCFWLVMWWPRHGQWWRDGWVAVLPHAGDWAYRYDATSPEGEG